MSKKIFSLVMTLLLVFSMIVPTIAAPLEDVKDTKYEEAVARLNALGILTGYEDGTFKADKTITRAEFAAVSMRALGLDETAKSSKGATAFKDVAATHWASGYINLATSKGVIKGYTDGTFKPEKEVSYAEAVTMLVRLLGYEPAVEKTNWPSNYLVKGAEIGVTGTLNFDQSSPATRGDVAILTNNSLDIDLMETETYGTDIEYKEQDGETLLTEYLNVHELEEAIVSKTYAYSQGTLDQNEVEIQYYDEDSEDTETYVFEVSEGVNFESLLGHEVTLFVKDDDNDEKVEDDEVVLMAMSTTDARDIIAWDWIDAMSTDGDEGDDDDWDFEDNKVEITLDSTDDTFEVAEDAVVYYNFEKVTNLADLASEKEGVGYAYLWETAGTIILDDNDDIIFMDMVNLDLPVVITEVDVEDEEVKYFNETESESTIDLDGEEYAIYKDGKIADLEDLEQDDVLYYWELSDGSYVLSAFASKITGTLESVDSDSNKYWDYSLVVDGKTIYVGPKFTISTDENDTIDLLGKPYEVADKDMVSALEDMVGYEVTVYLGRYQEANYVDSENGFDAFNYARHIVSEVDVDDDEEFMVTDAPWHSRTAGDLYYVELVNAKDVGVVYEFTEDDTEFNGETLDLSADITSVDEEDLDHPHSYYEDYGTGSNDTFLDYVNQLLEEGTLVDVDFNSDGTIASVDTYDVLTGNATDVEEVDEDYDQIKIDGKWWTVTEETAFFEKVNGEATDWESIEDVSDPDDITAYAMKVDEDDDELEALVLVANEDLGSIGRSDYGYVLKRTVKSDGVWVTLAVEDSWGEYYAGDLSNDDDLVEGVLVDFTADGNELDDADEVDAWIHEETVTATVYDESIDLSKGAFDAADITVEDGSGNAVEVEVDDNEIVTATGGTVVGTWDDDELTVKAGYSVTLAWDSFEIASGGVDGKNGKIEVFVAGGDEDIDDTFYIYVDRYGDDTYYYDVDKSHLADPETKILEVDDLSDGDVIEVFDTEDNGITEIVSVIDR